MYYQWIYNQSVPNSLLQKHKCLTIDRDLFLQKKSKFFSCWCKYDRQTFGCLCFSSSSRSWKFSLSNLINFFSKTDQQELRQQINATIASAWCNTYRKTWRFLTFLSRKNAQKKWCQQWDLNPRQYTLTRTLHLAEEAFRLSLAP